MKTLQIPGSLLMKFHGKRDDVPVTTKGEMNYASKL